jgi:hypothetical protein
MKLIMFSAILTVVSCATAQDSSSTAAACYKLEFDQSNPNAEGLGLMPTYLILDYGSDQGGAYRKDVLRVFRNGTKRSPFWRETGDSVFVFNPVSKFTQIRFKFQSRSDELVGTGWYSTDVEGVPHDMIQVIAKREECH